MEQFPRTDPPRRAAGFILVALALLGFGVAVFADHIASYYLLQWAPTLKRYPTHEERASVLQALVLDRASHGAMWLTLAGSLVAWRRASSRREARPRAGLAAGWMALGIGGYAALRAIVESQLTIRLVRVPNLELGIDWHGPGFAIGAMVMLMAALLAARRVGRPIAVVSGARH